MKVTLKDIADRANVSVSSVSRALNRTPSSASVNHETRLRILQAAKELGYFKFHSVQRESARAEEKRIGLILHDVKQKYQDPYFSEIIYGIESELMDQGCVFEFTLEVQDVLRSEALAEVDKSNLGVLCVGPLRHEYMDEISRQVPVLFSVGGLPQPEVDCVTVDFRGAARRAVQHLIRLGHRRIAFVGGSSVVGMPMEQEERYLGYKQVMEEHRLRIEPKWVKDAGFHMTKSYEAAKDILMDTDRPTALFAASDNMAYGVYKAANECGLSVPEDLSVISFDNIDTSEFVNPPLTTVKVPKEEMGRIAVKLLIQRMEGALPVPMHVFLPTALMIRSSCKKRSGEF